MDIILYLRRGSFELQKIIIISIGSAHGSREHGVYLRRTI